MPFHTRAQTAATVGPTGAPTTGQVVQNISTAALSILGNILGQREARRTQPPAVIQPAVTTRTALGGGVGLLIVAAIVAVFLLRPGR